MSTQKDLRLSHSVAVTAEILHSQFAATHIGRRGYIARAKDRVRPEQPTSYVVTKNDVGWHREGYKGLNIRLLTHDGYEFEIQLHTVASLEAAEKMHALYNEERLFPIGSAQRRRLQAKQQKTWNSVPIPPDVPILD